MIALFRANPEAFNGNINQLRAGAILRVPPSADIANIASSEAASEVSQQNAAWRAAGGGQEAGRLKLVTPPEGEGETATAPQPSGRVEGQVNSLEKDIAEQKRLLELKNQELADLQKKLADARAQEEAAKQPTAARAGPGDARRADGRVGDCAGRRHLEAGDPAGRGKAEAGEAEACAEGGREVRPFVPRHADRQLEDPGRRGAPARARIPRRSTSCAAGATRTWTAR